MKRPDKTSSGLPNLAVEEDDSEETSLSVFEEAVTKPRMQDMLGAHACLIVTSGADAVSEESERFFMLSDPELWIGRATTCAVRVYGEGVSRQHARIVRDGCDYMLEDFDSANGTFLNGQRIQGRYRLTNGDRIRIGSTILRFEWQDENWVEEPTSTRRELLEPWSPNSWRSHPSNEVPAYDAVALANVVERLQRLPPLVTGWDIDRLKGQLADAEIGARFVLQGGDCTETVAGCTPATIGKTLKLLLQMSLVLTHATRKPVIRIGRIAGQYARPRLGPTETRGGVTLPSYVGDLVNRPEFTEAARRPDAELLIEGYRHAALTLNYLRALTAGGFSDLRRLGYFDLPTFDGGELPPVLRAELARMSQQVAEGLHFLRAVGDHSFDDLARVEFFTSHEAINLAYETGQTAQVPRREGWYCRSTHLPWLGDSTRVRSGPHVEFLRGIANPIGIKVGPRATADELVSLLRMLNPSDEPGKIVLITRLGAGVVPNVLPRLLEGVSRSRRRALWIVDPMHANGVVTKRGILTRYLDAILQELEETFSVHENAGIGLGGVHFEFAGGDDIKECVGAGITEADLNPRDESSCDPRLNHRQAIEVAFHVARRIDVSSMRKKSSRPPIR